MCNVRGSHAERLADFRLPTHAGPEIGVASTKAFTTQLVALLALALAWRAARGARRRGDGRLWSAPRSLPYDLEARARPAAARSPPSPRSSSTPPNALYLGRGVLYPLALEGALKLKEISYLHAEGYPAGEMKHGPIALLDEAFPVIALCPPGELAEKVRSNIAGGARAQGAGVRHRRRRTTRTCASSPAPSSRSPTLPWPLLPIVAAVPLQLLAYEVAVRRGCDVDQPRNLAKSVTVE